jgi:ubiquinone/menaquinone biosynthesis C-methylase UbiE
MPVRHDARSTMLGLSAHADLYHRLTHRVFGPLHRRITTDVTTAAPTGRILDVGTGPGTLPLAIAHAAPHLRIDGIDLSPAMIAAARRDCMAAGLDRQVAFEIADVASLPFPDATFDLVISSMSLHHWADPPAAMRDLRRVIRDTGQIWIYDARPALRRGLTATHAAFPHHTVRVEPIRFGRFPIAVFGRLLVQPHGWRHGRGGPRK